MPRLEETKEFHGLPVATFDRDAHDDLVAEGSAWFLEAAIIDPPELPEVLGRFFERADPSQVTALLLGFAGFDGPSGGEALLDVADRFPRLQALSLAHSANFDIMHAVDDITPVLEGLPQLERLDVRGTRNLKFRPVRHETLKTLRIESCNLPSEIVRAINDSEFPALENLDLWLGVRTSEVDVAEADDLGPILTGERLPSLRTLGLQNSGTQDDIAEEIATAPVVARLQRLSLARGTLSDRGAEALLTGQPLTHLEHLDLHHNFLSDAMMERLKAAFPTTEVDVSHRILDFQGPFDEEVFNFVADGRDF